MQAQVQFRRDDGEVFGHASCRGLRRVASVSDPVRRTDLRQFNYVSRPIADTGIHGQRDHFAEITQRIGVFPSFQFHRLMLLSGDYPLKSRSFLSPHGGGDGIAELIVRVVSVRVRHELVDTHAAQDFVADHLKGGV